MVPSRDEDVKNGYEMMMLRCSGRWPGRGNGPGCGSGRGSCSCGDGGRVKSIGEAGLAEST